MDYGRTSSYLRQRVEDQEVIKALADTLSRLEGLEAEAKAREARIEELKSEHSLLDEKIAGAKAHVVDLDREVDAAVADSAKYISDAKQKAADAVAKADADASKALAKLASDLKKEQDAYAVTVADLHNDIKSLETRRVAAQVALDALKNV